MKRWAYLCSLGVLFVVFLCAGTVKILQPRAFQESILDYQVSSIATAALLAWWLPWFEVLCALSLWWPRFRRAGLAGITVMTTGFLILLVSAISRKLSITCGCFGSSGHDLGIAIAIDSALLTTCLTAWWAAPGQGNKGDQSRKSSLSATR